MDCRPSTDKGATPCFLRSIGRRRGRPEGQRPEIFGDRDCRIVGSGVVELPNCRIVGPDLSHLKISHGPLTVIAWRSRRNLYDPVGVEHLTSARLFYKHMIPLGSPNNSSNAGAVVDRISPRTTDDGRAVVGWGLIVELSNR